LAGLQEKSLLPTPLLQKLLTTLSARERQALQEIVNPVDSMHLDRADGTHDLDEKDIEQRMEEDRERHKRLREDTWAVDPETELEQLFESGRAGLTGKLIQDCRDDLKARVQAIELDKLGYEMGDTPMGGT
jgi:CTD kinase subunit gamma